MWDPYSGRPGNSHDAPHGCKQGTAMQNTMLLSLSEPVTSTPSFWVPRCSLQSEELCSLHFCRMIGKGKSHADLRLLQLIEPLDGKFKKKSLSHRGPAGHKGEAFPHCSWSCDCSLDKRSRDLDLKMSGGCYREVTVTLRCCSLYSCSINSDNRLLRPKFSKRGL